MTAIHDKINTVTKEQSISMKWNIGIAIAIVVAALVVWGLAADGAEPASKPAAAPSNRPVHLFILSGQSNMEGMNPKGGFEAEAAKLFPGADMAYVKFARGGRPIRCWVAEWDDIAKKHGLDPVPFRARDKEDMKGTPYYQPILDEFTKLLEKHPQPASVTFCWMQGESDASQKCDAAYGDALQQLIANLRRDLKQPKMYFVIGRISDCQENAAWNTVRKAQVALASADPRGAWVDCDDLNDKEKDGNKFNDLHYTKEGYELLGRRFVRQAKALIEGRKPAADGRPE